MESPVHALDSRAKAVAFLGLVVIIVTTPPEEWWAFAIYACFLGAVAVASRLPFTFILKRMLIVVPFVIVVAIFLPFTAGGEAIYHLGPLAVSKEGLLSLWNVTAKSMLAVSSMVLLSSTTPFPHLMHAFERLHVPSFFTQIASFMYRYLFLIVDEAQRMKRAIEARNYRGRWLWQSKAIGNVIASLFLRSQERSERVYQAMCARGFEGSFPGGKESSMRLRDCAFTALTLGCALAGRLVTIWK
ncbi:MAG: cobalt ECF transporter T component CbiQ [Actinomycetota bacterium]|nr:cobalt ECF transporter T component CbiQ [Actinomycetota bacterium]